MKGRISDDVSIYGLNVLVVLYFSCWLIIYLVI